MNYRLLSPLLSLGLAITGCAPKTVQLSTIPERKLEVQKITLGAAQTLKLGMSGNDVITGLGSPNIITTDKDGNETWVYDKIFREYEYVIAQDEGWLIGPKKQHSGVQTSTERTLIVVIRFDKDKRISNVQYRQTSY